MLCSRRKTHFIVYSFVYQDSMCGIVGLLGNVSHKLLLDSLKQLQNRGYDSAGICTINADVNSHFDIIKYASDKDNSAIQKLEQNIVYNNNIIIGIGHTRWATHGPKTDLNSHPHMCMNQKFCLVHNGIIENYKILKNMLVENGYTFKSQTDTEVIVNLLSFEYNIIINDISY